MEDSENSFDGIQELDNSIPRWITYLFVVTVFAAVIYFVHFHVFFQGKLQEAEYEAAISQFQKTKSVSNFDENNFSLLSDNESLEKGKELFVEKTCASCHGNLGEGNAIGPNLADNSWIHGGKPTQVFKTIKYGFQEKGMPAFNSQMSDNQALMVVSYILLKIKGSNPANAKPPQGVQE